MSKTELKDLVISRAKLDAIWVTGRGSWHLEPHESSLGAGSVSSYFLPGGKFVVLLYKSGALSLKEIQDPDSGEWGLVDVARYEQQSENPLFWSELLTETNYERPALACVNGTLDKYVRFKGGARF